MKTIIWMALIPVLFLAGCAAPGGTSYDETPSTAPWYIRDEVPPLPVPPESLGSAPGDHNRALIYAEEVNVVILNEE